ncbi:MAG: MFS transporter, partial [bacterium]|nr:MFS transporter [bacterium]
MTTGFYNKYLLFIAGLGGLLYGIDVGVIAGALPYLQATTDYSASQISFVVAAVLLGSVISSLFAGTLADIFGRKKVMILSGICFVLSVPVICLFDGFAWLVAGRILQGAAGGFIGVVVPLYLAECLPAEKRGFGTGMFQFMLTIGLVFAALAGIVCAGYVEGVEGAQYATIAEKGAAIYAAKDFAWKAIFWICAIPGVIFSLGALVISESARWLYKKGKKEAALAAIVRSRGEEGGKKEYDEMAAEPVAEEKTTEAAPVKKDSLLKKKYVVPFLLAVIILACNQATGVNSVLAYIVDVLSQAGLEGALANWGDLIVKCLNCGMTIIAMILVDRLGRKSLLTIGTSGIIIGLLGVAILFWRSEAKMVDCTEKVPVIPVTLSETKMDEKLGIPVLDENKKEIKEDVKYEANISFPAKYLAHISGLTDVKDFQVKVVYTQGEEKVIKTIIAKQDAKDDEVAFKVKQAKDDEGKEILPFKLEAIEVGPLPSATNGWLVTIFFALFIASFAVGPGVCVWLALSELMPNRIRAVGMSIALLINQGVSTVIAATFLPVVGSLGYSFIFFFCAGCTVI